MNKYLKYILGIPTLILFLFSCTEDNNDIAGYMPERSDVMLIDELKSYYKGSDVQLMPENLYGYSKTTGIVISDIKNKNIPLNHIVIQATDAQNIDNVKRSPGIILALNNESDNVFQLGDSVLVDLTGTVLTKIDGNIQIKGLPGNQITTLKSGCNVKPRILTLKELYNNFDIYTGTLVKIVAGIYPYPVYGTTLGEGDQPMPIGEDDKNIYLHTTSYATFADKVIMPSSDVIGIAIWNENNKAVSMRKVEDMQNESGPMYTNFPEDFELPSIAAGGVPKDLTSYNSGTNKGIFKTGEWLLYQAILVDPVISGTAGRDRITGKQGIRMQRDLAKNNIEYGTLEMQFDLAHGATKLSFNHGIYHTDAPVTFWMEYSTDSGATWTKIGESIVTDNGAFSQTYMLDITGKIRFRVHKPGALGDGRLSIDNIAVYQKSW